MPHPPHTTDVSGLRDLVSRIEGTRPGAPRRREAGFPAPVSLGDGGLGDGGLGDGGLPLDRLLSGGLRRGTLHEVVGEGVGDAAAAAGFALAVAGRCAGLDPLVWIVEDHVASETGLPYRPGLGAHGIDPDRLILVRTADGPATLWALEEALRLGARAVLAELWGAKHYGLAASRRLLLAAQRGRGTAVLLHAGLAGRGAALSSAAETRLAVRACPSPRLASAGGRTPIPGRPRRVGEAAQAPPRHRRRGRPRPPPSHRLEPRSKVLRCPPATFRSSCRCCRPTASGAAGGVRRRLRAGPGPDEPLVTVAKVRGAQRVTAADAAAAARGLRPGLALADARALCPAVLVAEADPEADAALMGAVVDWCRRFTPLAAPDGEDGAVLDIGGASHLFGGEAGLVEALVSGLRRQGLAARAAVASTPEAAWALARFGAASVAGFGTEPVAPTPLEPGFGPLARRPAGRRGGAAARPRNRGGPRPRRARAGRRPPGPSPRPRRGPVRRRGAGAARRADGARQGPDRAALRGPAACVAERRFAGGLAEMEQIEAALLPLCRHLCAALARQGQGARRVAASFFRVDGAVKHLALGTSRPTREPEALLALFREKLAAIGEDGLDTGYGFDLIRLAVTEAERLDARQEDLAGDDPARSRDAAMADLADRLGARLGLRRVLRLAPHDTHVPECAVVALPAARGAPRGPAAVKAAQDAARDAARDGARDEALCRPIRLFERPERIDTIASVPDGPPLRFRWRRVLHEVAAIEGPERIAPEWWTGAAELTRDYFRAEDRDGRRFWLYREGLFGGRETDEPRWYLHGLFG